MHPRSRRASGSPGSLRGVRGVCLGFLDDPLQLGDRCGEPTVPLSGTHVPHHSVDAFFHGTALGFRTIGSQAFKDTIGGSKPVLRDLEVSDFLGEFTQLRTWVGSRGCDLVDEGFGRGNRTEKFLANRIVDMGALDAGPQILTRMLRIVLCFVEAILSSMGLVLGSVSFCSRLLSAILPWRHRATPFPRSMRAIGA